MAKELLTECRAIEGGSEDDLATIFKGKYPETHEGMCMLTCANEKIGVVS